MAGLKQLRGSALEEDINAKYADKHQIHRDMEILATAIGKEVLVYLKKVN